MLGSASRRLNLCYQSPMPAIEVRPCPACLERDSRARGEVGGFRMRTCQRCRTLFTARLPVAAESTDYGGYYHPGNLEVPAFVHRQLERVVASFEPWRRCNRWLDVGCGAGALMAAARRRRWDVIGTEVAAGAAEAVRAQGFEVRTGELERLGLPAGGFDVISMVEVVEHVPDPRALLDAAGTLLRPEGAIYITTPHARGVSARLLRTRWSVVSPPEHLQLFSARGLRGAAVAAGLRVCELHTHNIDPNELLRAARSRSGPAVAPGARVESSYRLNESLSSNRAGTILKRVANATLSATRLGDSLKLVAERQR